MSDSLLSLLGSAEDTLRFTYVDGGVTVMERGHSTGWRAMSVAMAAQHPNGFSRCETADGQVIRIQEGETLFLPPGVLHKIDKLGTQPSTSIWSHFTCTIFNVVSIFSLLPIPIILKGDTASQVGTLNERLWSLHTQDLLSPSLLLRRKALGFLLISTLAEHSAFQEERIQELSALQQLIPVLQYIDKHLDHVLSRNELAALMNLSPSHFYSVFKSTLGISPGDYVQKQRLQKAQSLLLGTEDSVTMIAHQTGYEDVFHFSRLFKKRYGLSPSLYRKQRKMV